MQANKNKKTDAINLTNGDDALPCVKVRIDKWLWAARLFKTRSLASHVVDGGKVKCNQMRVKPAYGVKVGDVLNVSVGWDDLELVIQGLAEKRGSARVAQTLYAETARSAEQRAQRAANRKLLQDPALEIKSRPTKRQRRDIDELKWTES